MQGASHGKEITFYSEGVPLWGKIFVPKEHNDGEKRAAVIVLQGFAGRYDYLGAAEATAMRLAAAGYVAFGFECRTFGKSAPPGTVPLADPFMESIDIRNAITYLQTRSEVDEMRIGLIGSSFGAFTAAYVAAIDKRVAAVVCRAPIGDGYRWLRSQRTAEEWINFVKELEEDRRQRVLTGKGRVVHPHYIYNLKGPHREVSLAAARKSGTAEGFLLQAAESIIQFKPENYVHLIAPRPVLYIMPAMDYVTPVEEAISLYEKSNEPKTMWLIPNKFFAKDQYEVHEGSHDPDLKKPSKAKTMFEPILAWMKDNMSNEVRYAEMEYHPPKLRPGFASLSLDEVSWLKRDSRDQA